MCSSVGYFIHSKIIYIFMKIKISRMKSETASHELRKTIIFSFILLSKRLIEDRQMNLESVVMKN